ncbi:MAG: hypothetical protein RLZZ282_1650 [Verrucomicrobiota bacterium]|jgi:uncharacterized membrane protein YeiH
MNLSFELVAVFVAAVSGALAGRQKDMDLFGMFVVGLLTSMGGGTLRSLLIGDLPPPVFQDSIYLEVTAVGVFVARYGAPWWSKIRRVVSVVDAMSLGMFVSIGIRSSQEHGLAWWACVVNGVITATFGGVLRDIVRAEVPLIFRKEIYATACLIGGVALIGLDRVGVPSILGVGVITILITTIRLLAIRYALNQSSC